MGRKHPHMLMGKIETGDGRQGSLTLGLICSVVGCALKLSDGLMQRRSSGIDAELEHCGIRIGHRPSDSLERRSVSKVSPSATYTA